MKRFMKMGISLCIMTSICFASALPAYAAAPHRYFKQEVEGFLNEEDQLMKFDLILPKYIGSFTTEITLGFDSSKRKDTNWDPYRSQDASVYTKEVKIAVVRANPSTGKSLSSTPVQELKNSIVEYARIPSGEIIDTFQDKYHPGFIIPYSTDGFFKSTKIEAKDRNGDGISVFLSEASNYLLSSYTSILFTSERGDNIVTAGGGDFSAGFDYILPLTEEDEAYFLETGKFNVEDWGWSKIDWSGLRTVLTNPEAAPPVNIALDMTTVRTYQAEPFTSTIRFLQLNDKEVPFQAYHIQGSPCYSLRDILSALNGAPNQANILVHPETNKIEILKGQPYTPTGKEFQATDGTVKTAEAKRVLLCGKTYDGYDYMNPYTGYIIDGEYYFSMGNLKSIINFELFRGVYPKTMLPKIDAGKPDDMLQIY